MTSVHKPMKHVLTDSYLKPLPESPVWDEEGQNVLDAATGDDGYWRTRFSSALMSTGLLLRNLRREEVHINVWVMSVIVPPTVTLPPEKAAIATHIRRAFAKRGLKVAPKEMTVTERREHSLKCVFIFGVAAPQDL